MGLLHLRVLVHYDHSGTWKPAVRHRTGDVTILPLEQATGSELKTGSDLSIYKTSKFTPTVTHFLLLQQGQNYCYKATSPNSASSSEFMEDYYIQTALHSTQNYDLIIFKILFCSQCLLV